MNIKKYIYIIGMIYVAGVFGYYLTENLLFLFFMPLFPIVFIIDIWVRDEITSLIDKLMHHDIHFPFDKWLHHK